MSIDNKTWRTEKRDPYTVYGRRRVGGRCERDNITWETRQKPDEGSPGFRSRWLNIRLTTVVGVEAKLLHQQLVASLFSQSYGSWETRKKEYEVCPDKK